MRQKKNIYYRKYISFFPTLPHIFFKNFFKMSAHLSQRHSSFLFHLLMFVFSFYSNIDAPSLFQWSSIVFSLLAFNSLFKFFCFSVISHFYRQPLFPPTTVSLIRPLRVVQRKVRHFEENVCFIAKSRMRRVSRLYTKYEATLA